ncbi:hypothetical protein E4U41_006154 [Claviceps citrina]|nr:hypothetical protein E4U41_006154 [Claviceps citrina]
MASMASNRVKEADTSVTTPASQTPPRHAQTDTDDFGLPIRRYQIPSDEAIAAASIAPTDEADAAKEAKAANDVNKPPYANSAVPAAAVQEETDLETDLETSSRPDAQLRKDSPDSNSDSDSDSASASDSDATAFEDAQSALPNDPVSTSTGKAADLNAGAQTSAEAETTTTTTANAASTSGPTSVQDESLPPLVQTPKAISDKAQPIVREASRTNENERMTDEWPENPTAAAGAGAAAASTTTTTTENKEKDAEHAGQSKAKHRRDASAVSAASIGSGMNPGLSEFSHQHLSVQQEEDKEDADDGWQTMPAFAPYDMYDDDNRLIAREHNDEEDEKDAYAGLGGAGKGYTRVIMDDDADSVTSMDDTTQYLFKEANGTGLADEEGRDAVSQMQATKDLLTEGQRIAYVGVVRLEIAKVIKESEQMEITKQTKKETTTSAEALKMWGQKMMIRLYAHMDISEAEQLMIEQLAEHGVVPKDLTPALHANSRVHNPMAEDVPGMSGDGSPRPASTASSSSSVPAAGEDDKSAEAALPPYESPDHGELPAVQTPSQLPTTEKIDIDLRWTVLCDLFLILIADSVYDARSRVLLERVGRSLDITWIDICRFEKRVTDALEMQQAAERENWNEDEHMESRRKLALKKRYVMMGLATVGGGLVIGLSAGLLAPVIGAGLAAGFTTIGVTGTSGFLAGAGGAAIITSSAAASGSLIGGRAANRRTGPVKTFEYRPLHNNKRVNLVVTVSGWLTGKVDDVRLPFSTVDPVMGDIYSVFWEPEMLRSMGDTINILATEALTQGLQQILGSTILISLMAALQLPIVLTKLSYLIDNPWAVSLDRATAAGLILADSLMDRSLGTRPITLVGYSIGARVIFSCLQELSKRGAYGLVQNVYLFGSPIVVKKDEFLRARTVVAGRFVNGYNRNDWILGYLFRLTNGGIRRVAGLAPVEEVPWLENMDVTEQVSGHMQYRTAMPVLLKKCGWVVESEVFTEIEDPDPDKHDERQRELINEIEEARKELERDGKRKSKGRFSLFGRRKKAERQEWEVYEESAGRDGSKEGKGKGSGSGSNGKLEDKSGNNHGVLFDIDAIRAELAKESYDDASAETALQIKEIKSTLPPMQLDMSPPAAAGARPGSLRETKSSVDMSSSSSSMSGRGRGFGSAHSSWRVQQQQQQQQQQPEPGAYRPVAYQDEEVEMVFDTAFENDYPSGGLLDHHDHDHDHDQYATVPPTDGQNRRSRSVSSLGRPEMRTSQTVPNLALGMADPWADIEDEDFGKEQEISMTFA